MIQPVSDKRQDLNLQPDSRACLLSTSEYCLYIKSWSMHIRVILRDLLCHRDSNQPRWCLEKKHLRATVFQNRNKYGSSKKNSREQNKVQGEETAEIRLYPQTQRCHWNVTFLMRWASMGLSQAGPRPVPSCLFCKRAANIWRMRPLSEATFISFLVGIK